MYIYAIEELVCYRFCSFINMVHSICTIVELSRKETRQSMRVQNLFEWSRTSLIYQTYSVYSEKFS
jgi:hypothetical protein